MAGRLENKVALITGGARGMGKAEVELFAAEGAQVVIADILTAEGEALAKEVGDRARFVELDVADEAAWEAAVARTVGELGRLDVLVNNAGIAILAPFATYSSEDFMRVVAVNQLGVFLGMRIASAAMAENGGSIVNISSIDGMTGSAMAIAYCASKFAVRGMTKVAALELAPLNIRVNSVHPGVVRTQIFESAAPGMDVAALCAPMIPAKRIGEPEEIAHLALFLASDDSSYCTGAEFVADGGVMAGMKLELSDDAWAVA